MKKFIVFCLVIILSLSVVCPVSIAQEETKYSGTVYYVDATNGNNTNDGLSPQTPFKTFMTIHGNKLLPGDAVLFKRGETFTVSGININASGTKEDPITFSCYGDENDPLPLIIGRNSGSMKGVVFINSQSYVHIDSLHIKSLYTGSNSVGGVRIESANGGTVYGNKISNCVIDGENGDWASQNGRTFTGISVNAKDYWGFFDGVTIENNEIYNCKSLGISVNGCHGGCDKNGNVSSKSGKNIVIRNNFLYNIGKDGILVNNCNSPLIEYNTCGKSHSYAKTSWHVAMWPFSCYNALFQYNESYDTQTTYDGQGFDSDYLSYNSTFQYNYSHNNVGGFILICTEPKADWLSDPTAYNVGTVVRYNISQNDYYRIFTLVHHITDTKIYNNTIYADKNVQHIFFVSAHRDASLNPINTLIYNNIFYTNNGNFQWLKSTGTEFKNNIIYGANASKYPKNDIDETTDDNIVSSGNIFADPMLVRAGFAEYGLESCYVYKLKEGSPALNAGLIIDDDSNKLDFFGNEVSQSEKPHIGAYNGEPIKLENGDVNYDGEVSISDALWLIKYFVKEYDESKIDTNYSDMNKDGLIDAKDILMLRQKLAN